MKHYLIKRKIENNLKNANSIRQFDGFDNIESILIAYDLEDYQKAIALKTSLSEIQKESFLFGYSKEKEPNRSNNEGYVYCSNEVDWIGAPNKKVISDFNKISKDCQLLIDLSNSNNLSISYLISISTIKFKCGIGLNHFNLIDFVIDIPKNVDAKFLCEQIMFYLRKLKSQRPRLV